MKYFWWRLIDYIVGALVGGLIVFVVNRYLCHKCVGDATFVLLLGIWIGFMLFCNFMFQKFKPKSIQKS